jgi:predicted DNA-binding protein with PD1-like motif
MTVLDLADGFLLRFFRDEEIVSGLTAFAESSGITAAWVNGLGALSRAELGYWDAEKREYLRLPVEEEVEIASLVGNVSRVEGAAFPHLHVTLGRRDFSTLGGHLFRGVGGATVEIYVRTYPQALVRARDEAVGLNLWALPRRLEPPATPRS